MDLAIIPPDKLTMEDIEQVYDLGNDRAQMACQLLIKAQQEGLSALELSASYGAIGKLLFRKITTISDHVLK